MCQKNVKYLFTVLDKYFSRLNSKNVYTTKNIDFCNFQHFFSFPSLRWRIFPLTLNIDVEVFGAENLKNVLIKRFKFSETTTFFSQVES